MRGHVRLQLLTHELLDNVSLWSNGTWEFIEQQQILSKLSAVASLDPSTILMLWQLLTDKPKLVCLY
jgi:hypothetical protein